MKKLHNDKNSKMKVEKNAVNFCSKPQKKKKRKEKDLCSTESSENKLQTSEHLSALNTTLSFATIQGPL